MSNTIPLPKSIPEMFAIYAKSPASNAQGYQRALRFEAKPSDVFIATSLKSGTTWVQQIVHSLRSDGSFDFADISDVVPTLDIGYQIGRDLQAPQVAEPRVFKSHMMWSEIPKGARYIYIIRNPKDTFLSYYRFLDGWKLERGAVSMQSFSDFLFLNKQIPKCNWFEINLPWFDQRNNPNVLLLGFENLKADLKYAVRQIAAFLEMPLEHDLLEVVLEQSSFASMKKHGEKYGAADQMKLTELMGWPSGEKSPLVRSGRVGDHKLAMPAELAAQIDASWQTYVTERYGFQTYNDMRAEIARTNR